MCDCCEYNRIIKLRQTTPIIKRNSDILTFSAKLFYEGKECGILNGRTDHMPNIKDDSNIR